MNNKYKIGDYLCNKGSSPLFIAKIVDIDDKSYNYKLQYIRSLHKIHDYWEEESHLDKYYKKLPPIMELIYF